MSHSTPQGVATEANGATCFTQGSDSHRLQDGGYVLVYGLEKYGQDHSDCTIEPEDFLQMVSEWMDGRAAPCLERATITITSMPRAKWDSYAEVGNGVSQEVPNE